MLCDPGMIRYPVGRIEKQDCVRAGRVDWISVHESDQGGLRARCHPEAGPSLVDALKAVPVRFRPSGLSDNMIELFHHRR